MRAGECQPSTSAGVQRPRDQRGVDVSVEAVFTPPTLQGAPRTSSAPARRWPARTRTGWRCSQCRQGGALADDDERELAARQGRPGAQLAGAEPRRRGGRRHPRLHLPFARSDSSQRQRGGSIGIRSARFPTTTRSPEEDGANRSAEAEHRAGGAPLLAGQVGPPGSADGKAWISSRRARRAISVNPQSAAAVVRYPGHYDQPATRWPRSRRPRASTSTDTAMPIEHGVPPQLPQREHRLSGR